MVEKYPDLERGESASKRRRKHISTRLFKQTINLPKQARAIKTTLDGITPFNAEKKKAEAEKMVSTDGEFLRVAQKYNVTINGLLTENDKLEAGKSQ